MACELERSLVARLKEELATAQDDCNAGVHLQCGKAQALGRQLLRAQSELQSCLAAVPPTPGHPPPPPPPHHVTGVCDPEQAIVDDLSEEYRDAQADCNQGEHGQCRRALILLGLLSDARAELQSCQTKLPLHMEGIEVTQAIQDRNHSVALIAGKRTVVRVYLSCVASRPVKVRGSITVSHASGSSTTVPTVKTVTLDPAVSGDVNAMRNDAALSLNFVLPDAFTAEGVLTIALAGVQKVNSGTAMVVERATPLSVRFLAGSPIRVRILGLRYITGAPPRSFAPSDRDFNMLVSWLRRAYPVTQVISTRAILDAMATPPFENDHFTDVNACNAQLAAIRRLDVSGGTDRRTHYYGMVSDGDGAAGCFLKGQAAGIPKKPDPGTVATGPTGSSQYPWDADGSYGDFYGGHEIGHTLGRRHPGFCDNQMQDDSKYPYKDGQLANTDGSFVGFDVGDASLNLPMAALPGTTWHDVMTYCDFQWVSNYAYEGIRVRANAEANMAAGFKQTPSQTGGRPDDRLPEKLVAEPKMGVGQMLISIIATINLTKRKGKIEFVHPLQEGEQSPLQQGSRVMLRFNRADGQMLNEYPVGVKINSCIEPGEDYTGLLDATLAVESDARAIELLIEGQVVDTFRAGATNPSVYSLRRIDDERRNLAVTWEGSVETNDDVTYIVQASTDEGRSWITLAVGLKTPTYTIDRRNFEGATQVQVRVITTNGFTQSIVTNEPFQLG